jgi:hypothetical protein
MALAIITADQRRQQTTIKGQVWGKAGVGKTTLLKTLDPATTLALDFEGGLLSVQRDDQFGPAWMGDSIKVESWPEAKVILSTFQQKHEAFAKYRTVFIDSTTVASRMCFDWCKEQPEAFNKQGQKNNLGAYGLLGLEMVDWVKGWHHLPGVNVWLVGGLERKDQEGLGKEWTPLLTGSKLASELPYIMDYCLVMAHFKAGDGKTYAGIFTDPLKNPEYASVPLKTRVGGLDQIEQPHLGRLMAKALGPQPSAQVAPPPSSVSAQPSGEASTPPINETSEAA